MKTTRPADLSGSSPNVLSRLIRKPRGAMARLQTLGIVLVLTACASIPLTVGFGTWATQQAMRKEWTAHGAACPIVPQLSIAARGPKPPPPFVYQGVGFAYQIGDVSCVAVPEGWIRRGTYPVCEFDAPAGIQVTYRGRTTVFEPGVGHGASVTVRHGQISCAVTGAYGPRR
jgi:hypothetical protein